MKINFKNAFLQDWEKLLKTIMRTFLFLCFTTAFSFTPNNTFSQNAKIFIEADKKISVSQIFDLIQEQAGYKFVYSDEIIANAPEVDLKRGVIRANELLKKGLSPIGCTFEFTKNETVIVRKETRAISKEVPQVSISGTVKDSDGQPLPGANVVEKGTTNGTQTDFDGNFTITVSDTEATLVISYIGFSTKEITIENQSQIEVTLQEDTAGLDEVVVVGYGSQSRAKVTGAISSVKAEQIADLPVTSFDQALAGQISGVQVSQGTGSPGEGAEIKVRGVGTLTAGSNPLLVIDGFPSESVRISDINPNDIESVQVLKDAASSAIYGSRGSNGVILISTKKSRGNETKISFNSYTGFQQVANTYHMADGYEWAEFQLATLRALNPASFPADYIPDAYVPYINGTPGLTSTDWQDEIFRSAPITSYQVSALGGNDKTQYYISGEFFDQEGIIISTDYKRYNFRANITSTILDRPEASFLNNVKLGVSLAPTYSISNRVSQSHHNEDGILITALYAYPNFAAHNPDGSFNISEQILFGQSPTGLKNGGARFENPVAVAHERDQVFKRFNFLGNTYLDFELIDGLNFKTYFGLSYSDSEENVFRPSTIGRRRDPAPTTALGRLDNGRILNWINENTLTYQKTFNEDHNLNVLLGHSIQKESLFSSFLTSENASANNLATFNGTNVITGGDTLEEEWALISYLSRVNYDYKGKYLISASFRRDGSSRFGDNSKWGNFPSVSLGWRLSEEDFLLDNKTISDLKLRASWGVTGNNLIPNYGGTALLGNANYGSLGGFSTITSPNPNLSWEETKQVDFGMDLSLFNGHVSIIADYYNSTTDGLLLNVPVPSQSGFTNSLQNLGEVENKGFEFAISANNVKLGEVEWSSSFNIAFNDNKVLSLGTDQTRIIEKFHKTEVGRPIGEFYLWNITGVYNTQAEIDATPHVSGTLPGDYIVEDVNGDNVINGEDRKVIGSPLPDFTYGFSTSFKYKGFDLSTLLQGSVGNDVLNFNYFFISRNGDFANVLADRVNGRWQSPENPGTGFARAGAREFEYDQSSRLLQSGDFLRFRNITLGYTFNQNTLDKLGLDKLRLYLSSLNPFTFTKYEGYNPEVNSVTNTGGTSVRNGGPLQPGIDWGNYPSAKSFTIGLNLTF
ncbi:MAG: SusC/RagA family TonB-linked outer membrane protein [Allomuricauda sp.]